eukprot:907819-Prorocentrum_minimum.AAC.1
MVGRGPPPDLTPGQGGCVRAISEGRISILLTPGRRDPPAVCFPPAGGPGKEAAQRQGAQRQGNISKP